MGFEILEEGLFTTNEDKEFQIGMTSIVNRAGETVGEGRNIELTLEESLL